MHRLQKHPSSRLTGGEPVRSLLQQDIKRRDPMSEDCFALRLKSRTFTLREKKINKFQIFIHSETFNVIIAQIHRRLSPMLSANVDDAPLLARCCTHASVMASKTSSFSTTDFLLS